MPKEMEEPVGLGARVRMVHSQALNVLIGFFIIALGACSHSPHYQPPDIGPFATPGFAATPSGAHQRVLVQTRWWEDFNDPYLNQLVEQALQNNRSLEEAVQRLRAARFGIEAERLGRFPSGQVSSSVVRSRTAAAAIVTDVPSLDQSVEPFDDQVAYSLGTSASWEIDLFGRVNQLVNVARLTAQALDETLLDVQRVIVGDVVSAYASLQGIEQRLASVQMSAQLQLQTHNTTVDLFNAGELSQIDVLRARTNYQRTLTAIVSLQADQVVARNRLATLVGSAPAAFDGFAQTAIWRDDYLPVVLHIGSPVDLIRQRPDIRAAERRLAAETARIGVEVSNYYPRLVLNANVGLRSAEIQNFFSDAAFQYSLAPQVSLGVFDFPRIGARIRQQRATTQVALAQFDTTVLAALEETENALSRYAAQSQNAQRLSQIVSETTQLRNLTLESYRAGVLDYLRVLEAEQELVDAQATLAATRAERFIRLVEVYRAFGGGLTEIDLGRPS